MCEKPIKIFVNKEEYIVKCGRCPTCQRERTQEWAIKLINEAKYHKKACFITLTFDNKILLQGNKYGANCSFLYHINNSKEYFKKFIKRLRKHYKDKMITFFHTGEYGEITKRCHHHAILYGVNFDEDRIEMQASKTGHTQYWSKTLSDLWACGRVSIQDCNSSNIIYISQYSLKKFKNNELNKRYKPIYSFSNRSKMNCKWVRRNYNEIIKGYINDTDGHKYRIPKSYIKNLEKSEHNKHWKALRDYEDNLLEHIANSSDIDIIEQQKIKSKIKEKRTQLFNTVRDF